MSTTYTTNYHLGKQEDRSDNFNMSVITDNMDTIDSVLGNKSDKSSTYTKTEVDTALAGKQDTISDLSTIRSGAAAGATAVQPAALETALAQKQDALSSEQLDAVNSGVTSDDVEQITTNKNNISDISKNNVINIFTRQTGTYSHNDVTFTTNADGSITLANTATGGTAVLTLSSSLDTTDDTYILYGDGFISCVYMDTFEAGYANRREFTTYVETTTNTKKWRIVVDENTNVDGVTLRPMMCKKSLFDNNYHQYAMSNEQITAWILAHS